MNQGRGIDSAALRRASLNGAIKSAQLERLGVSSKAQTIRCGVNGAWQRILPGVVLLHNGPPTNLQRLSAAKLYGGPEAQLSGHAALGLHGYDASATMNDVLLIVPADRHRKPASFVRVERTWRMPEPVRRGSFECAPVTRAAIDATRASRNSEKIESLLAQAIQRGDTTLEELAIELAEGQRRYSGLTRMALKRLSRNAHSVPEIEAQQLYARTGLPPMVFNQNTFDEAGNFVARPDGWIDDIGLAWEIDSLQHHFSPADHERTVKRRAIMKRHGAVVVETFPTQLDSDEDTVVADLFAGVRDAVARPRPKLYLRPPRAA